MDKYKLYYYELTRYINALAKDCDNHSGLLLAHGIDDPWAISREIFDRLNPEVKDYLQKLRGDDETE